MEGRNNKPNPNEKRSLVRSYNEDDEPLHQSPPNNKVYHAHNNSSGVFVENPVTNERFINGSDGVVYGKIVSTLPVPNPLEATCWYCRQCEPAGELYKPCPCESLIHRNCFRQWRTGWINPRNYFSCPNCMHSYNLERVRTASTESKERMRTNYRMAVVKVWASVVVVFGAVVAALAGISYGCDTSEKNIPVAVRVLLTSVVAGFPNSNSTTMWHEEFKRPDVAVWPYYSLFGLFLTSILILVSFSCIGCTFDESDRRRSGHCNCLDDCCVGASNGLNVWVVPDGGGNCCSCCDCTVDRGGCHGSHCGNCSGGSVNCDGGGDAGPIIAVIILVIVVIIIFSAVLVVLLFAIQKCSLLYDRLTAMLLSQQSELEGETVVLGMGESWRPNDAV